MAGLVELPSAIPDLYSDAVHGVLFLPPDLCGAVEYYQRAFDSGTGYYVYWVSQVPNPTPSPIDTVPNYTGTLSAYSYVIRTDLSVV